MKVITKMDSIPNYASDVVEILKKRALRSGLKIVKVFDDILPDEEPDVVYTNLILQGSRLAMIKYFGEDLVHGYYEKGEFFKTLRLMFL